MAPRDVNSEHPRPVGESTLAYLLVSDMAASP